MVSDAHRCYTSSVISITMTPKLMSAQASRRDIPGCLPSGTEGERAGIAPLLINTIIASSCCFAISPS